MKRFYYYKFIFYQDLPHLIGIFDSAVIPKVCRSSEWFEVTFEATNFIQARTNAAKLLDVLKSCTGINWFFKNMSIEVVQPQLL